jgi:hydroxymethylglutaryl-CoA synthase
MPGIAAYGVYLPRLRIPRKLIAGAMGWLSGGKKPGRGERTACNWDEDSLTMGLEAIRDALPDYASRRDVRSLVLASTTLPFADRSNATLVASALDLPDSVLAADVGGSQRAGTTALAQAFTQRAASGPDGRIVVAAADRRLARPGSEQELTYGHGAAAMVVGADDGLARCIGARHLAADFVDHHRLAGETFDYTLEERWTREAGWFAQVPPVVRELLTTSEVPSSSIRHFIVPADGGIGKRLATLCGIAEDRLTDPMTDLCGLTGCGHSMLMLAAVLEKAAPGDLILLVGFGQGVDALLLQATDRIGTVRPRRGVAASLRARHEETDYTRFLAHCGILQVETGMRAERDARTAQPALWRKHAEVTALTGGRCERCGTVQFPRSRICVAPECRATDTQLPHLLAENTGRIKTFTEDWLAFTARPPLLYGNIAFADGGNAFIEFADFDPGEAQVDAAVRFVFRLKDIDRLRGFRRYFWKAAPLGDA